MAPPLFKRTWGSLPCTWSLRGKLRIKKPLLRLFDHTPNVMKTERNHFPISRGNTAQLRYLHRILI
jgi:hypothetical protein